MSLVLVWNPSVYPFKELPTLREKIRNGEPAIHKWSLGASKDAEMGERIWLFKRKPTPGIVASGRIVGGSNLDKHFATNRKGPALYAPIEFDSILDEPLPASVLVGELGPAWGYPVSGWICPVIDYPILVELWGLHVQANGAIFAQSLSDELESLGQFIW